MPFPFDKYPWLNFQELNLAYFIKHFREIFEQWNTLLNEMYSWKDATDAELEEWKSTVETGISSWEAGLLQSMEDWKDETEADISAWEAATLSALNAWKTATTAVFEQIRTEAAASAQAAAGSATAAQTALAGAQTAQAAAEAAAAGIQSELAQIQTNTADIAALEAEIESVQDITDNIYNTAWITKNTFDESIPLNASNAVTQGGTRYVTLTNNSNQDSYIVYLHAGDIIAAPDTLPGYYSMVVGYGYSGTWITDSASRRMACESATRYRTSDSNLPTKAAPLTLEDDAILIITLTKNNPAEFLQLESTRELNSETTLAPEQIAQITSIYDDKIRVYKRGKYAYIFVKAFTQWLKYTVEHYTNASTDADMWLLRKCDLCGSFELDAATLFPVVIEGQWEMAIKMVSDSVDFIGGKNHGSEIMIDTAFFVDGKPADFTVTDTDILCNEFSFIVNSYMHYPSDPTATVGIHHNKVTFTKTNVVMEESIEWKVSDSVRNSFICMLPMCRGNDGNTPVQVTKYGYDYITYTAYDIGTAGFDNYMKENIPGRTKITEYSADSGINATAEIVGDFVSGQYGFIQNSGDTIYNAYNKIYLTYAPNNQPVTDGDLWQWKNIYTITHTD